jgi:hypothetical protein
MIMNRKPTGVVELVVAYFKMMFYARPQKISFLSLFKGVFSPPGKLRMRYQDYYKLRTRIWKEADVACFKEGLLSQHSHLEVNYIGQSRW